MVAKTQEEKIGNAADEGTTRRSLFIAFLCIVGISVAGSVSAFLRYDLIGTGHLPRCALYPVLYLLLLKPLLKKTKRIRPFNPTELLFIYSTILVMTGIPGQQFATYLYLGMVGPIYYATPQNQYAQRFHQWIPDWLVPSKDPHSDTIAWLFEGMPEEKGFFDIPWGDWITPLAAWIPFCLMVYFVTLCIAALLRRQWSDRERLLFPLARVPVEIVNGGTRGSLFRNRIMWFAFSVPFLVYLINGLQKYFPSLFHINLYPSTRHLFSEKPWYVLNWIPMNYYFGMIGIAYMLTTEVGFSFWFFYLFERLQRIFRLSSGLHTEWAVFQFQDIGGIIILGLFYLWVGRNHWASIARKALGRGQDVDDSDEPMSYRFAFFGSIVGLITLTLWCRAAGIAVYLSLFLFLFYFLVLIILTRIVSEAGIFVWWAPIAPQEFVIRAIGSHNIHPSNIPMLAMVGWNLQDIATSVMPQTLNAYRIASGMKINRKTFTAILMMALVVSVMSCHIPCIYVTYRHAVPNLGWWTRGAPRSCALQIDRFLRLPHELDGENLIHMLEGGGLALFLLFMRQRFIWWPFHPLGYIASLHIGRYWWSILVGWTAKVVVTKLGGIKTWRRYYPAALGLVIGNCVILFTWLLFHFIKPIQGVLLIE